MRNRMIKTTVIAVLILGILFSTAACTESEGAILDRLESAKNTYETLKNRIPEDPDWSEKKEISAEYKTIDKSLISIADSTLPEVTQFLGEFYYEAAMWEATQWTNKEEAGEYFKKCPVGSNGHRISEILNVINNESKVKGIKLLIQEFGGDMALVEAISDTYLGFYGEKDSLEEATQIALGGAIVQSHVTGKTGTDLWVDEDALSLVRTGIECAPSNYTLSEAERSSLQNSLGTNPDSKILILHLRNLYNGGTELDLHLNMMQYINPEYLPQSLEEVEYILLFTGSYEKRGEYENGTIAISENTVLKVYKVGMNDALYESEKLEKPESWLMQYFGKTPPEYYSGGYPEANDIIQEAIQIIKKDMK